MSVRTALAGRLAVVALMVLGSSAVVTQAAEEAAPRPLAAGEAVQLGGHKAVLTKLDTLPYVESEYSKRFHFDAYDNPKLKDLRERYRLDQVVASGKDEFERQLLLLDWVNHRFKKFGKPSSPARGALDILEANDAGNSFFCSHYGDLFVSAAPRPWGGSTVPWRCAARTTSAAAAPSTRPPRSGPTSTASGSCSTRPSRCTSKRTACR